MTPYSPLYTPPVAWGVVLLFNYPLGPRRCYSNLKKQQQQNIIFELIIQNWNLDNRCEIAFRWISQILTYKKSASVQIMGWCRKTTSHYLDQCWHDDVIRWKHFPRYWPFVRGIHRSPVNSQHKGQWRGALMFSFICVWINGWVNNGETGDLRRYRAHYDVSVMDSDLCRHMASLGLNVLIWIRRAPSITLFFSQSDHCIGVPRRASIYLAVFYLQSTLKTLTLIS